MKPVVTFLISLALVLTIIDRSFAQAPQPDPKSAQYHATGEQDRSYNFPGTGESIAYHLYVPAKWTAASRLPLVVVTHGANQPATAPFQRPMTNPTLAKAAEARGFIVAAVTGYHANATGVGGWNVPYPMVQGRRPPRAGGAAAGAGRDRANVPIHDPWVKDRDVRAVSRAKNRANVKICRP